jgi:Domain of unknown function (DUF4485)
MSATSSSGLDVSFLVMVKEIERNYQSLSKQLKIRIEKWIVKLVTSGAENYVWRKHRNEYAKLLLHMVLLKRLSDPFHILPPDGQLSQFPRYLSSSNFHEKAVDAHQIDFWNDIYHRIDSKMPVTKITSPVHVRHCTASYDDSSTAKEANVTWESKQSRVSEFSEFQLRIQYLEQQLRDEKMRYALQVQRLQDAHRVEIYAYAEVINSTSSLLQSSSHDMSTLLRHDSITNRASFPVEESRTLATTQDGRCNLSNGISQSGDDLNAQKGTIENMMSEFDKSAASSRPTFHQNSSVISDFKHSKVHDSLYDESSDSLNDTDQLSSSSLPHYLSRPVTGERVFPSETSRFAFPPYSLDLPKRHLHGTSLRNSSDTNMSSPINIDRSRPERIDADEKVHFDESFLEYIDEFQEELKRIQASSPLLKS